MIEEERKAGEFITIFSKVQGSYLSHAHAEFILSSLRWEREERTPDMEVAVRNQAKGGESKR
jgi:hypothetical protein